MTMMGRVWARMNRMVMMMVTLMIMIMMMVVMRMTVHSERSVQCDTCSKKMFGDIIVQGVAGM